MSIKEEIAELKREIKELKENQNLKCSVVNCNKTIKDTSTLKPMTVEEAIMPLPPQPLMEGIVGIDYHGRIIEPAIFDENGFVKVPGWILNEKQKRYEYIDSECNVLKTELAEIVDGNISRMKEWHVKKKKLSEK